MRNQLVIAGKANASIPVVDVNSLFVLVTGLIQQWCEIVNVALGILAQHLE